MTTLTIAIVARPGTPDVPCDDPPALALGSDVEDVDPAVPDAVDEAVEEELPLELAPDGDVAASLASITAKAASAMPGECGR